MVQKTVASVADAQGSPLAVAIAVSGHHLTGDEPAELGGADRGPSPYDLLTAALGACTAMTLRWFALQKGWPLIHVEVQVTHRKIMATGSDAIIDEFAKTLAITGPDLTEEQRDKLIEVAARCPVHKTLTGQIRIEQSVA